MTQKKVMICDDDEGILDMLQLVLENDDLKVFTISNSLDLLQLIAEHQPDLLLLDLWMPVLSGDLILKRLREQEMTHMLPVMVISASRDGEDIALANGADDFLAKPFDLDELSERVQRLLNRRKASA